MSTSAIIGVVVAALVIVGVVALVAVYLRRKGSGPRLRELEPEARQRFAHRWATAQEGFVDRPAESLAEADRLVVDVLAERGYPSEADGERRANDLPGDYRTAREVLERTKGGKVSTEDMREAMVRYRTVFQDLVGHDRKARDNHSAVSTAARTGH